MYKYNLSSCFEYRCVFDVSFSRRYFRFFSEFFSEKVRKGGTNVELKGEYFEMMPDELHYFLLSQTIAILLMN